MATESSSDNTRDTDIVGHVIGIDLGTTYSCVAVWKPSGVEVIPSSCGDLATPSTVRFHGSTSGTVYGVKRIIGRKFDEKEVQDDIRSWPFRVVKKEGKPFVQVESDQGPQQYAPEEISAMLVEKLIEEAECYLGGEVGGVVVTVPAYFNSLQREATKAACEMAGVRVLRVISEPTAAGIAYGLGLKRGMSRTLIFDLGGGTLDVSVIEMEEKKSRVLAATGNMHLGGEDFDARLVEYFVKEFSVSRKVDLKQNPGAMERLKKACEIAKRRLSSAERADVVLYNIFGKYDLVSSITRTRFQSICNDLFHKCLQPVQELLLEQNISQKDIHRIVLVGGSSHMPKVRQLLSQFFGGRELSYDINPDTAVALGAAIYASTLAKRGNLEVQVGDVAPQSLGVRCIDDRMSTIIKRNTPLPASEYRMYTTVRDYQTRVRFDAYEGEYDDTTNNLLIGGFTLENIEQARSGKPSIKVTFNVSEDGITTVQARDMATESENSAAFNNKRRRLNDLEVERMVKEAKKIRTQDRVKESLSDAIDQLEEFDADLAAYARAHNVQHSIATRTMHPARALDCLVDWIKASPFSQSSKASRSIQHLRDSYQP